MIEKLFLDQAILISIPISLISLLFLIYEIATTIESNSKFVKEKGRITPYSVIPMTSMWFLLLFFTFYTLSSIINLLFNPLSLTAEKIELLKYLKFHFNILGSFSLLLFGYFKWHSHFHATNTNKYSQFFILSLFALLTYLSFQNSYSHPHTPILQMSIDLFGHLLFISPLLSFKSSKENQFEIELTSNLNKIVCLSLFTHLIFKSIFEIHFSFSKMELNRPLSDYFYYLTLLLNFISIIFLHLSLNNYRTQLSFKNNQNNHYFEKVVISIVLFLVVTGSLLFYLQSINYKEIVSKYDHKRSEVSFFWETQKIIAFNILNLIVDDHFGIHYSKLADNYTPLLNTIVDRFCNIFPNRNINTCYLLNEKGIVIASTNRNSKDSFVNLNLKNRTYFKEALKGNFGQYISMGIVTKRPGLYLSKPYNYQINKTTIKGVATIKLEITPLLVPFLNGINNDSFIISDEQGIILSSENSNNHLKLFWKSSIPQLENTINKKQYQISAIDLIKASNPLNYKPKTQDIIFYQNNFQSVFTFFDQETNLNFFIFKSLKSLGDMSSKNSIYFILLYTLFCIIRMILNRLNQTKEQSIDHFTKFIYLSTHSSQIIFQINNDFKITFISDTIKNLNSFSSKELLMKDFKELFPQDVQDDIKKHLIGVYDNQSFVGETPLLTKMKTTIPCELSLEPIRRCENTIIGIQGALRDLTEKKLKEKNQKDLQNKLYQADKMASLGIMAAGLAHEINNPLSIIKGHLQILEEEFKDKNVPGSFYEGSFKTIFNAIQRTIEIINNMKIYSHHDGNNFHPKEIEFLSVVNQTLQLCQKIIEKDNITFKIENISSHTLIMGQSGKLQQVILNLINNSKDSIIEKRESLKDKSFEGFLNLKLITDKDILHFSVQDNGLGMSETTQKHLFDLFYTTKEVGKGTGLGLSIMQSIIKEHEGEIHVTSKRGEGTTFTLSFKLLNKLSKDSEKGPDEGPGEEKLPKAA